MPDIVAVARSACAACLPVPALLAAAAPPSLLSTQVYMSCSCSWQESANDRMCSAAKCHSTCGCRTALARHVKSFDSTTLTFEHSAASLAHFASADSSALTPTSASSVVHSIYTAQAVHLTCMRARRQNNSLPDIATILHSACLQLRLVT